MSAEQKTAVKQHIRTLKTKRDDALSRQAYDEAQQIRRGIRTLKRKSRALARTIKAQATTAAAAPAAS